MRGYLHHRNANCRIEKRSQVEEDQSLLKKESAVQSKFIGTHISFFVKVAEYVSVCFLRCVEWNHKSSAPFIFEEHCSWRSKMLPGKFYLGEEVRM
uniref:Uncharacterized protein n=1 Tax=Parascaris equorum TaxID=6256 RepID=A0A914RJG5_PAREQ